MHKGLGKPSIVAICSSVLFAAFFIAPAPSAFAQDAIEEDLSDGRTFGIGGEAFVPTLTVAYLSGRFWASDSVGFDGGAGALSIPAVATFPSFIGRLLLKVVDSTSTDFYLAVGGSTVLIGSGGPVMSREDGLPFQGQPTNVLVGAGIEHSFARTTALSGEVDLVIGGGGFNIIAGAAFHFYIGAN